MRKATLAMLAVAGLGLSACGATIGQIDKTRFLVTENAGNYDVRDLTRACGSISNILSIKHVENAGSDSSAVVTCRVAP